MKMRHESAGKQKASPRAGSRSGRIKISNILVPTDFSPESKKTLEFASQYAEQFGAGVIVMNVIEPSPEGDSESIPSVLARGRDFVETQQALQSFAGQSIKPDVLKNTKVYAGRAYEEIVNAAKHLEADLIIMSIHSNAGGDNNLIGSTTEHVIRFAQCPVLTLRSHVTK